MLKKIILIISFVLILLAGSKSFAQGVSLPYTDVGVCPFEGCTYREWIARRNTVVYKAMEKGSSVFFNVKKGEKVQALTGTVVTTKPGQVRILQDMKIGGFNVRAGDVLYMLTYQGEGFYTVWYKGRLTQAEISDGRLMRVLSEPKSVWWVKIKNKKGQVGWTRMPDNFGNKDLYA